MKFATSKFETELTLNHLVAKMLCKI